MSIESELKKLNGYLEAFLDLMQKGEIVTTDTSQSEVVETVPSTLEPPPGAGIQSASTETTIPIPPQQGQITPLTEEQMQETFMRLGPIVNHPQLTGDFVGNHLRNTYGVQDLSSVGQERLEPFLVSVYQAARMIVPDLQAA